MASFAFKKFSVYHSRSSMKVGVDAVLLGAWVNATGRRVLDVGCGCGIISLMIAQRNSSAKIYAIDIHEDSVSEAALNFESSPWPERLFAVKRDFNEVDDDLNFDLIVSNPPYYKAGIEDLNSPRLRARHQGSLSPISLLEKGSSLIGYGGRVAMVMPVDVFKDLCVETSSTGMHTERICFVRRSNGLPYRRVLVEFANEELSDISVEWLTMFYADDSPTAEYLTLCKEFYLKF